MKWAEAAIFIAFLIYLALMATMMALGGKAKAQYAPMPLYQHPPANIPDPYALSGMESCCSRHDCAPWPGADIEGPMPDGSYWIKSANDGKGAKVEKYRIRQSFNGQYHLCKPTINGDPTVVGTYYDGTARIYCLLVPMGV